MNLIVSSIVGGACEQNSIVNSVLVDNCAAKRQIIASNEISGNVQFVSMLQTVKKFLKRF